MTNLVVKSDNAAVDVNTLDMSKLNEQLGFSTKKRLSFPMLKINRVAEDDGGNALPVGTFYIEGLEGEKVYSKNITMRVLFRGYQYTLFDAKEKKMLDSSVILPTFFGEFKSQSGKLACGRLSKKRVKEIGEHNLTAEQKYFQENVKVKTHLFVSVSYEGKTQDGETSTVTNALCLYNPSSKAAYTIDEVLAGVEKEGRTIPLTTLNVKTKREKTGDNVYYVPVVEVEQGAAAPDAQVVEHIRTAVGFVESSNEYITKRYTEVLAGGKSTDPALDSIAENMWEDGE